MPRDKKDGVVKTGDASLIGSTTDGDETFGEALSKAGFEPAKVGL
jgi:hypothetical protein